MEGKNLNYNQKFIKKKKRTEEKKENRKAEGVVPAPSPTKAGPGGGRGGLPRSAPIIAWLIGRAGRIW